MEDRKLFIFTLGTGLYNDFIDKQMTTWDYAFPYVKNKYFFIISDNNKFKKNINDHIYFLKIHDIQYNINTLFKFKYCKYALIENNIEYTDNDVFLFVDSDTLFLNNNDKGYDNVYDILCSHDLLVTPYILFHYPGHRNTMCDGWNEQSNEYAGFYKVTDKNINICTNIIGGNIKTLFNIINDIDNLLALDFKNRAHKHFPVINEETYINKIVNEHINNNLSTYNIFISQIYGTDFTDSNNPYFDFFGNIQNQLCSFKNIIVNSKYNIDAKKKPKDNWYINELIWEKYIDFTYIFTGINYDHSLEEEFKKIYIKNYRYEYIIFNDVLNINNIIHSSNLFNNLIYVNYEYYKCVKEAYKLNYNSIMLLNDYITFINTGKIIKEQLNKYNNTADIILLNTSKENCSVYILNRHGMKYIIDSIEKILCNTNVEINEVTHVNVDVDLFK